MKTISELSTGTSLMRGRRILFDDSSVALLCNVGLWLDLMGESAA